MIEGIIYTLALLLIVSFIGFIMYNVFSFIAGRIRNGRDTIILAFSGTFDRPLRNNYEKYFLGRFAFYEKLPGEMRVKFLLRVRNFVRAKTFEGRQELDVSEEMKVWIAASAVQLTFGLENYVLDFFDRIIVYPESYYSPVTGLYHMGEANPRGILVISWKDFRKGYDVPDDTYNVGLHEMAHALELEKQLGGDFDFYFSTYYEKWKRIAEDEYQRVHESESSFFRVYAGTNRHEFFAVCIEHFFEASEEFKKRLPQVYHHLCILLNQDPLSADTRIQRVNQKSREEISLEVGSSPEVFTTKYSLAKLIFLPVTWVIVNVVAVLGLESFNKAFFSISLVIASVYALPFAFLRKKIVLYEKYIAVKGGSGNMKAIYPLEDVVSVSLGAEGSNGAIEILVVKNGRIYKEHYSYLSTTKDTSTLVKLRQRKVIVR